MPKIIFSYGPIPRYQKNIRFSHENINKKYTPTTYQEKGEVIKPKPLYQFEFHNMKRKGTSGRNLQRIYCWLEYYTYVVRLFEQMVFVISSLEFEF